MDKELDQVHLRELIDRITEGVISLNLEGEIIYINKCGASFFNRDQKELINENIKALFPTFETADLYEKYIKDQKLQEPFKLDLQVPGFQNHFYHLHVYPSHTGFTIMFNNNTEQRVQQQMLDAFYEKVFAQAHEGLFIMDLNGNISIMNDGNGSHMIQREDYVRNISNHHLIRENVEKVKQGEVREFYLDFKQINGSYVHYHVSLYPVQFMNKVHSVLGLLRDLSKIEQLEWNLYRSEQKYRSLKYHNSDGIISFDIQGNLIGVNPAFEKITGYSKKDIIQIHTDELFAKEDEQILKKLMKEILNGEGTVDTYNMTLKHRDGRRLLVVVKFVPIYIEEQLEGFYIIIRDVTKIKETEEKLIQSEKLSAIGQLAASIVHEIRNPLTSLLGFMQLIEKQKQMNTDYFRIMSEELNRIDTITNELLFMAKPKEKHLQLGNTQQILNDVVRLMNSQAIKSNIQIHFMVESELPYIQCDEKQLKQVFINILKNGLEAMEGRLGTITVSAGFHRINRNEIKITFTDEGMGMTEEQMENITKPFFTTKQNGTGLGMLMTHNIIKSHKGRLEIESEVNKGTTITIYLPIRQ